LCPASGACYSYLLGSWRVTVSVLCAPPTIPAEVSLTMDRFGAVLRPTRQLLSVLAMSALLLALAGCSFFGTTRAGPRHLVIATLFAASGVYATTELPAQYGVDLAVSQAHLPDGYTVSVMHEDYGDATAGLKTDSAITTEVHALVNDSHVVGVVGPFSSREATLAMPITNLAGLSLISPTNTSPSLTLEFYAHDYGLNWSLVHPPGYPNRYFRLPANDVEQGQLDAYIAAHVLGAKTAFIVYDNSIDGTGGRYGADLASYFISAFTSVAGRTIVSAQAQTQGNMIDDFNIPELVAAIVARNPDLVYYGGVTSGGGAELKKALVLAGYTKPLLGGDGIANDPAWLTVAGSGAGDTYGTVAVPDVSALTSRQAQQFVSAYEANYLANPPLTAIPTPDSVLAYDATNTLIAALSQAIQQGAGRSLSDLRTQTGAVLASPRFQYSGLTGKITFDRNGDNAGQRIFSVYKVSSSADTAPQWHVFQLYRCSGGTTLSCQTISHL
jgi:branched-chain amino acid transport system substrate-binding protein